MTTTDQVWDLVVVGGGTAGIVGAKTAARLGARVLLVEADRTGGDCLWTGCVPSKALLAAADSAHAARVSGRLGVEVGSVTVDFAAVMSHVHAAIEQISPVDSPEALEAEGVTVLAGRASFDSPASVRVGDTRIRFRQALLSTGAAPAVPPIPGLDQVPYLTSDTVWDLQTLPDRLVVLGGGSIGCELGQGFARLGSDVTIVEGASRVLPREDAQASQVIQDALKAEGVLVETGSAVARVEPRSGGGVLILDDGRAVEFSSLLVAVGRSPRTRDLGLERAGVSVGAHGFVVVDASLRTTNTRIYAAGDLTGHPQFTHTAGVHGSLAASNAVLGVRRKVDTTSVPRVTFTQPEVAAVGLPALRAGARGRSVSWEHTHVDRAVTDGDVTGYTTLTLDPKGRILGATVVGPRAGETIGELTLAVKQGLRARDLAGATHPYPTYSDGAWNAAILDVRHQLEAPGTARTLRALARSRRWWVSRVGPRTRRAGSAGS